MKIKIILVSILLLLFTIFASGCLPFMENIGMISPTNEEQLSPEKGGPPDGLVKVLIGFKEKPGPAQQALVKGVGGQIKYTYNIIPAIAASVPEVAIDALKKNPNITDVELDSMVYALDAELDNSWGVKRIGAGNVHELDNRGDGVKVAIIDTGIDYTHPDLNANYAGGYDFVNDDNDPMDDDITYGHGTHVAGIIAALDNDFGVVGVAPEASLYALKVLNSEGVGYVSDVIFAIQWATDPDGDGSANDRLDIINMSLGADRGNIFFKWACNLAYRDGLLLVAAAGNSGSVIYPAAYSSVVAVSATDEEDNLASFSSTGSKVELAAPGVSIYSTYIGGYATMSGTSMASPHVAGTAALVWAVNSGWTNDDVRAQLQDTADDLGASGRDSLYGYGLVNAAEAVGVDTDTTPPAKVTSLNVTTVSCTQLVLAWDANTEEDLENYNVYRSTTSGSLYDLVASPTTNSYSDLGLTASTTYYYVVTAVDNSGNEGEKSDEAFGTTSADDLLGPLTSDVVADPNPTNGTTSVILTADVSDATTGNSNINEAEYFLDSVGADGFGTPMSASDGAFNSPTEGVTASIDVSGWADGQYTLSVHGKDAEGNWGATESVVLDVTEAPSNIMYVDSIIFSVKKAGPNKFLYTTIKVLDGDGSVLEGVRVEMTLEHELKGPWNFASDTDTDGTVKFTLKKAPSGFYTAAVTSLTLTGYKWDKTQGKISADHTL